MNEEIGRELKAHELVAQTVIVLNAEHRPEIFLTAWVEAITPNAVSFFAGLTKIHFIAGIQSDGTLKDDDGRAIKVFEYLGEI